MKIVKAWWWMCMAVFAASAAAQSGPSAGQGRLELQADAACTLTLDGRGAGALAPGERLVVEVSPGTHDLDCRSADWPEASARERISLQAGQTQALRLRLRWTAAPDGVLDRAQRLVWTRQDNGADIDMGAAAAWCTSLGAGWRLPRRAELEGLVAGAAGETTPCRGAQCRAPALFALSGYWMWSGERNDAGRVWYVYLHTGHTQASAPDYKLNARALCVRPA
ncbi:MAG: DUF1566 domain-containing protein [Rubrivivax sp.]|nr:DUF1566 domain-containing protein [Rubrivivax sp.]